MRNWTSSSIFDVYRELWCEGCKYSGSIPTVYLRDIVEVIVGEAPLRSKKEKWNKKRSTSDKSGSCVIAYIVKNDHWENLLGTSFLVDAVLSCRKRNRKVPVISTH